MKAPASAVDPADGNRDDDIADIRQALCGLLFGTVNIIVQDGVIVQIDRTEKRRVRKSELERQAKMRS